MLGLPIILRIVACLSLVGGGAYAGHHVTVSRCEIAMKRMQDEQAKAYAQAMTASYQSEAKLKAQLKALQGRHDDKVIESVVVNPVYRECKLDDAGMHIWNTFNSPHLPSTISDGDLQGLTPIGFTNDGRHAQEPRTGD